MTTDAQKIKEYLDSLEKLYGDLYPAAEGLNKGPLDAYIKHLEDANNYWKLITLCRTMLATIRGLDDPGFE